jgi:hypothetical protein
MKKILILCVLLTGLLVACDDATEDTSVKTGATQDLTSDPLAAAGLVGVMDTQGQRQRRIDYINNLHGRMITDDWDAFWLYERSSHLTPYIARTGR